MSAVAQSLKDIAADLIVREGECLDQRDWKAWLELYCEDAVYWVPAWRNESELVEDPDSEVSLIYHDSRLGLEERVTRLQSGKSASAVPLPRTTHFVGSVRATGDAARIEAHSSWQVMLYHPRTSQQHILFGRYEHDLVQRDGAWRIQRKKVNLLNDRLPTLLDFYCV